MHRSGRMLASIAVGTQCFRTLRVLSSDPDDTEPEPQEAGLKRTASVRICS
jgi:hypothetical protein